MALFLSTTVNKLDKKGRVSVPAAFRSELTEAFVTIYPSLNRPALEGCDRLRLDKLSASLDPLNASLDDLSKFSFSASAEALSVAFFAEAHRLSFDAEGRITLPETFLKHAGIQEVVAFVGRGAVFELWNPHNFEAYSAQLREKALGNLAEKGAGES